MQKQEILNALTPQIVDKFRTAIEMGISLAMNKDKFAYKR